MVNWRVYKPRNWARLGKPTDLRVSMLKTMTTQLIEHERICTTLAKAQALQRYAERVITLGKRGTPYAYDLAKGRLRSDRELHKLFTTLALRYRDREGGYTRIIRAGFRDYDATPMAYIELVDREGELRPAAKPQGANPLLPLAAQAWLRQQAALPPPQMAGAGALPSSGQGAGSSLLPDR